MLLMPATNDRLRHARVTATDAGRLATTFMSASCRRTRTATQVQVGLGLVTVIGTSSRNTESLGTTSTGNLGTTMEGRSTRIEMGLTIIKVIIKG